jgi:hypothetical protein
LRRVPRRALGGGVGHPPGRRGRLIVPGLARMARRWLQRRGSRRRT